MCKVAEAVLLSASAQVLTSWAWDRDPISSGLRAPGLQGSRAQGETQILPCHCQADAAYGHGAGWMPVFTRSAAECRRVPHGFAGKTREPRRGCKATQSPIMTFTVHDSQVQCFALRRTSLRHDPMHISAKESSARGAAQTAAAAVPEPKLEKLFCRCSLPVTEDEPGSTAA